MIKMIYSVVHRCLKVLPVGIAGRRVFDQTLADWRQEASSAKNPRGRLVATGRGLTAVIRSAALVSMREATGSEGLGSLARLVSWSIGTFLVIVVLRTYDPWSPRVLPEASPMRSVLWLGELMTVMPAVAFLSQTFGSRQSARRDTLGPVFFTGVLMLLTVGWVMPAANQSWREMVFALSGGTALLAPGLNERAITELIRIAISGSGSAVSVLGLRLGLIVSVPAMLVIGNWVRSLPGWRRLVGSLLPLPILAIPFVARLSGGYRPLLFWAAIFATALLVLVLSRGTGRGETGEPHDGLDPARP